METNWFEQAKAICLPQLSSKEIDVILRRDGAEDVVIKSSLERFNGVDPVDSYIAFDGCLYRHSNLVNATSEAEDEKYLFVQTSAAAFGADELWIKS